MTELIRIANALERIATALEPKPTPDAHAFLDAYNRSRGA